jgi:hypothetical protein
MTPLAAEARATALVVTLKGLGLTALAKTGPAVRETARQQQGPSETVLAQAVGAERAGRAERADARRVRRAGLRAPRARRPFAYQQVPREFRLRLPTGPL